MGLFRKLSLKSKGQSSAVASSASSSNRSNSSPVTTPEPQTPTSFSGPADCGLGYSSINHERSPSYKAKRMSKVALSRPIELDRYAESSSDEKPKRNGSVRRSNKLSSSMHKDEDPLFVHIVHESAPTPAIRSTVRAQSSLGSPPLNPATIDVPRPQSPFAITSAASQSFSSYNKPSRITPRRCHSANDSDSLRASSSTNRAFAEVASASDQSFFAVGRGWKKGVYTTKEEAERQIRNVSRHRRIFG